MGKYDALMSYQPQAPAAQGGGKYAALMGYQAQAEPTPVKDYISQSPSRFATGALQTLPGAGALMNKVQGREAYGEGLEGNAAKLGDASNALLTVATAGKGLGMGALLGGALEGSGANDAMRYAGKGMENLTNKALATDNPSKMLGIEGLGTASNLVSRTPGALADIAANLLPSLLASKAKFPAKEAASLPPEVQQRAAFAASEGIPLTRGETLGKTSPAAVREAGFRRAPGGEQAALEMQAKQQAAIREGLAKRTAGLGDDVLAGEIRQGGGMTEGRQLADVPEAAREIRSQRGKAVGDAKAALSQEIPIRSNFAKELSGTIDEALKKVSNAGKGSNRAKVADLLESYKDQARSVKTMAGAINFLDDFDSAIKGTFDREAPNVQKVHLAEVRNKILDVLDEAGSQIAPEAQANLKTAKAGFREVADPAQELRSLEENNPASLLRSISGGNKSLAKVQGFHQVFAEGTPQRQGLKSALVQDIIKKGTMKDGISGSAMQKALSKLDQSTLEAVFSDKPKELADFKNFVSSLADIEAQRQPLGTSPSGNSHTASLQKAIGSVVGLKVPGAGWAMNKLQEYRSGKAFKPYTLNEKAKVPTTGEVMQKKYGLNPALFGRQLQATAQGR